jgi:hypothetical protein
MFYSASKHAYRSQQIIEEGEIHWILFLGLIEKVTGKRFQIID